MPESEFLTLADLPVKQPRSRQHFRSALIILIVLVLAVLAIMIVGLVKISAPPSNGGAGSTVTGGVPPVTAVALITTVDTGPNNDLYPVVSGAAPVGATVTVKIDNAVVTATANDQGDWTTAGSPAEPTDSRGAITASIDNGGAAAVTLFELVAPPDLTADPTTAGNIVVTGLAEATVDIIVDGNPTTTVQLDADGKFLGPVNLAVGNHFLQVRYSDQDRHGPSSPATSVTGAD